jgi:hypothetical protein
MMQPAQDRSVDDFSEGHDVVVRGAHRNCLVDALMRSAFIEVVHVLSENAPQVSFTENQNVIEALSSEAAEEPFYARVHVRVQTEDDLDVGAFRDVVEPRAELAVVIPNDESRRVVEGGVAELLRGPLLRGVVGHGLVDDLSGVVFDDDESEALTEEGASGDELSLRLAEVGDSVGGDAGEA